MLRRLFGHSHAPTAPIEPQTAPRAQTQQPSALAVSNELLRPVVSHYGVRKNLGAVADLLRRVPPQRLRERAMRRATVEAQDTRAVEVLLRAGVDPTARSHNQRRDTALHHAAALTGQNVGPLRAMLAHREAQIKNGEPTFDVNVVIPAVDREELKQLAGNEWDGDPKPYELNTPLHAAVEAGSLAGVEALLGATGIALDKRNAQQRTPFDLARAMARQHPDVADRSAIVRRLQSAEARRPATDPHTDLGPILGAPPPYPWGPDGR